MSESQTIKPYILVPTYDVALSQSQFARNINDTKLLDYKISSNVIILGCGGIGSWVAKILGTCKSVKNMILFDPDQIEDSNLGRTPYRLLDIGSYKVEALAELITETNINCNVIPFNGYVTRENILQIREAYSSHFELTRNSYYSFDITYSQASAVTIIDCRDDDYQDYELFEEIFRDIFYDFRIIRGAYDSTSVTLDLSPKGRPVWGQRGYSVQSSHILPSVLSAILVVSAAFNYIDIRSKHMNQQRNDITGGGVNSHFNIPMTFDVNKMCEYVFFSNMIEKQLNKSERIYDIFREHLWSKFDFSTNNLEFLKQIKQEVEERINSLEQSGELTNA